jgi:hypothetical protein
MEEPDQRRHIQQFKKAEALACELDKLAAARHDFLLAYLPGFRVLKAQVEPDEGLLRVVAAFDTPAPLAGLLAARPFHAAMAPRNHGPFRHIGGVYMA